jgi:type IX secretion system PorP/SprF family membrane protein
MKTQINNKLYRFLQVAIICLITGKGFDAKAQYEPQFTQYMNNEMFINPAYAGTRGNLAATMLYRYQWVGIEGSPRTATFAVHSPFMYNKIGVGLCIMNDKIGVTNQTGVFANYAYHLQTSEKGTLSFGLQGGVINVKENLLDLVTIEENDPEFSQNIPNKLMPNFGYGMYYHTQKFYAGVSIPRFLENKVDPLSLKGYNNLNMHNWHYYLYSAYVLTQMKASKSSRLL